MSRVSELIEEIKIYNLCEYCNYYNGKNECLCVEGCNCREEIERQIVAEIREKTIEECKKLIKEMRLDNISSNGVNILDAIEQLKGKNNE